MNKTQGHYLFVILFGTHKGITIKASLDNLPLKPGLYEITCLHFV